MTKSDNERRALALSSGLSRTALVFDEKAIVGLLRIAIEREGSQSAFCRNYGINRSYVNRVLRGEKPVGDRAAEALGLRKAYIVK
jgi:hypothetical protein